MNRFGCSLQVLTGLGVMIFAIVVLYRAIAGLLLNPGAAIIIAFLLFLLGGALVASAEQKRGQRW